MAILDDLMSMVNSEPALKCVSQGANFRQIKSIERLTMKKGASGKIK